MRAIADAWKARRRVSSRSCRIHRTQELPRGIVSPAIYRGLEDGSLGYRRAASFKLRRFRMGTAPAADHPVVNPPIGCMNA